MKFLQSLKPYIISFLKERAVKLALKKLLGSIVTGGIRAWIIRFIVEELFEEVVEPLIKMALREAGWVYERAKGEIHVKRLEDAREDNDAQDYNDTVDDIMG